MTIKVRNQANIANKYVRFAKWKIRKIKAKFDQLLYAEVFITKEGHAVANYKAVVRLGVPGNDLILANTSQDLKQLWRDSLRDVERHLRKYKEKSVESKNRA